MIVTGLCVTVPRTPGWVDGPGDDRGFVRRTLGFLVGWICVVVTVDHVVDPRYLDVWVGR